MRGASSSSLSGSASSSSPSGATPTARRSTITRRSFGDPPPLPGKKAVVLPSRGSVSSAAAVSAAASRTSASTPPSAPSRPVPAISSAPVSAAPATPPAHPPRPSVTIIHKPTKEARKAEIVAAVTKRLYSQRKKPDPRSEHSSPTLPENTEEADEDDQPKELKLCSNARARLQEISKRALLFSLRRNRRDVEVQTEDPGCLRLKEKAVGTELVEQDEKASQWPPVPPVHCFPPFYLNSPWTPIGRRSRTLQSESSDDAFSDDSLEPSAASTEPDVTALWRVFTLKSGRKFSAPKLVEQPARVDVGTGISSDAGTMTVEDDQKTREVETMTLDFCEKGTMTTADVSVGTMTIEEDRTNDAATTTAEEEGPSRDAGTMTTREDGSANKNTEMQTEPSVQRPALGLTVSPDQQIQLVCDVRIAAAPCSCSAANIRLPTPPPVLSAGQRIPSGATDDRPQVPVQASASGAAPRDACSCGGKQQATPATTGAPPDIIAQARDPRDVDKDLTTVLRLQDGGREGFSLEIVRPSEYLCRSLEIVRPPENLSRSLDSLLHHLPPTPAPPQPPADLSPPPKKFRLPCFTESVAEPPRPTATARAINEIPNAALREDKNDPPKPVRRSPVLTARQRRLLLSLMRARSERGGPKPRRHRTLERQGPPPDAPPNRPSVELKPSRSLADLAGLLADESRQTILQNLSTLLGEAAVFVKSMNQVEKPHKTAEEPKEQDVDGDHRRSSHPEEKHLQDSGKASAARVCRAVSVDDRRSPLEDESVAYEGESRCRVYECGHRTSDRCHRHCDGRHPHVILVNEGTDAPPPETTNRSTSPLRERVVTTQSLSVSVCTQSTLDVATQCLLLFPRRMATSTRSTQCAAAETRFKRNASTQCDRVEVNCKSGRDVQPELVSSSSSLSEEEEDYDSEPVVRRKTASMVNLSSGMDLYWGTMTPKSRIARPWREYPLENRRPLLLPPEVICPFRAMSWHPRWPGWSGPGRGRPMSSPRQYLRHLVTLRRGVVMASRAVNPS